MEFQAKKNKKLYSYWFNQKFVNNIPLQTNADGCGVYYCLFADLCAKYSSHNLLVRTEIELNMSRYRKQNQYSILMQKKHLKIKEFIHPSYFWMDSSKILVRFLELICRWIHQPSIVSCTSDGFVRRFGQILEIHLSFPSDDCAYCQQSAARGARVRNLMLKSTLKPFLHLQIGKVIMSTGLLLHYNIII